MDALSLSIPLHVEAVADTDVVLPGDRARVRVDADLPRALADQTLSALGRLLVPGGLLSLEVLHPFNGVDVDLDVWHPREARLGQSQGLCTGREFFQWRNAGEIVDIRFNVYTFAPPGRDGNTRYTLIVTVDCR